MDKTPTIESALFANLIACVRELLLQWDNYKKFGRKRAKERATVALDRFGVSLLKSVEIISRIDVTSEMLRSKINGLRISVYELTPIYKNCRKDDLIDIPEEYYIQHIRNIERWVSRATTTHKQK